MKRGIFRLALVAAAQAGCGGSGGPALTIAINAGVEGDALKAAAREWGEQRRVRVEIVELPYANLFEKEMLDLTSKTGSVRMDFDQPAWFRPRPARIHLFDHQTTEALR